MVYTVCAETYSLKSSDNVWLTLKCGNVNGAIWK